MPDILEEIQALRLILNTTNDPAQKSILAGVIDQLEAKARTEPISVPDPQKLHQSEMNDSSMAGVNISGDLHGDANVSMTRDRYKAFFQIFFNAEGSENLSDKQEVLSQYLERISDRCDKLRLKGIVDWERKRGKIPSLTLSQVYISLASKSWKFEEISHLDTLIRLVVNGNEDEVLPQDVCISDDLNIREILFPTKKIVFNPKISYQIKKPLLINELLSNHRRIILLGSPGSGKSSFLRNLAVSLANMARDGQTSIIPGWKAGILLPIYISLGGFAEWTKVNSKEPSQENLWEYIIDNVEQFGLTGMKTHLNRSFREGKVLLMLDGLDEVNNPSIRIKVSKSVAKLSEFTRSYIIVTCRIRSFFGEIAEPFSDWGETAEIAPLKLGQIKHFVRQWYEHSAINNAFGIEDADERADLLIQRSNSIDTLHDLGRSPLLLTIITILHFYEGKLPEDRADLYEDIVQLLLTRWTQQRREVDAPPSLLDQLKKDGSLGGLKDYHLRNIIEDLAYRAHQGERSIDGRGLLERDQVAGALIRLFKAQYQH